MSRNVLISFLGLSNYIPCYYTIEGNPASLTRYVQTALYEHISKKVGELEVVIFCTKEAEERNWLGDEYSKGLRKTFHDIAPEARVKRVIIPSQQDERGNWELFDLIMNEIQADDEIYFDVTHSFRTNPIVALIVLNYAQVVKGASIGGLMYGWFEKLGSASEISELNKEERRIPIVDFTIMANLLSWTKGVDQFIRTGNASVLTDLATTESKLFYSQQDQTNTRDFAKMKSLIEQLNRVSLHFETVRTKSLYNEINKWKEKTDEVKNTRTQHFRQLIPLMDTIEKKVEDFSDDEVMNYYYMAKWCSEHSLIQQGLTILVEAVITVLCKILKVDELDTSSRRSISSALHVFLSKKPEEVWEGENELWHKTIDFITPFRELVEPFQKLNEYRNNINHAEMNTQMTEARRFETTLVESLNELRPFFEKMSKKLNEKDEVE